MAIILTFLTLLAWPFLGLALLRIGLLLFTKRSNEDLILFAEAMGHDPIGRALCRAALLAAVCGIWLIARANA